MTFTIAQQNESFFKRAKPWISYLILLIILGGIAYVVSLGMHKMPGLKQKSSLTALTSYEAEVYINSEKIGVTPLESVDIPAKGGELRIQSMSNPAVTYTTDLEIEPGTEVFVQRDLGVSSFFSSGQDLWLKKDKTNLTVISQPSGATVSIDGTEVGKTPLSLDKITEAEYDLKVSMSGYEGQNNRIKIVDGYRLNVSMQLFPLPLPANSRVFEDSGNLWDLTLNNENIAASPERARAITYWIETRPNAIVFGDNEDVAFEYYLDYRGNIFDNEGKAVTTDTGLESLRDKTVGAYLGFDTNTPGLTAEAREIFTRVFTASEKATVLQTGTGWLRVRDIPNLSGEEIGRVNVGESYTVLEKQTGWVKIKFSETQNGWVSADFVKTQ